MRLRNKKTGEIGNLIYRGLEDERIWVWIDNMSKPEYRYNSLAELNEEWEDAKEPKEDYIRVIESFINYVEEADESFYCDESVKKFVEKLKAVKRLKYKGFRFDKWCNDNEKYLGDFVIYAHTKDLTDIVGDLDLLFGGEDE